MGREHKDYFCIACCKLWYWTTKIRWDHCEGFAMIPHWWHWRYPRRYQAITWITDFMEAATSRISQFADDRKCVNPKGTGKV